jgi:hypothetical protein
MRGLHYHTEHPLELTNFFNGWGLADPWNQTSWESMLPEYEQLLGTLSFSSLFNLILIFFFSSFIVFLSLYRF